MHFAPSLKSTMGEGVLMGNSHLFIFLLHQKSWIRAWVSDNWGSSTFLQFLVTRNISDVILTFHTTLNVLKKWMITEKFECVFSYRP